MPVTVRRKSPSELVSPNQAYAHRPWDSLISNDDVHLRMNSTWSHKMMIGILHIQTFPASTGWYGSRDGALGTATRYGLHGPGIESWWGGEIFRARPDRPWGPPSPPYNENRVLPRGKAAGAWRWRPTPSSAEVKERVQLYLYSHSGPSWPVLRWTLPWPLPLLGGIL